MIKQTHFLFSQKTHARTHTFLKHTHTRLHLKARGELSLALNNITPNYLNLDPNYLNPNYPITNSDILKILKINSDSSGNKSWYPN